jgi:predicted O-methyltransferase YrrM
MEDDAPTRKKMHYRDELELLQKLGRESIGPVINLGCFRGASAAALASESKYEAYSVDKYYDFGPRPNGERNRVKWLHRQSFEPNAEAARALWDKLDLTVIQCIGTTDEWAVKLKDVRFGVVFIDADHQYDACKADYENWLPLVMPGGVIAFHDNNTVAVKDVLRDCVDLEKLLEVERTTVYRVA